jgi:cephalosporin hydroxylase
LAIADLLWRMRPDLVIELGTSGGGSAAFYGHVMKEYNPKARLLTIDPASVCVHTLLLIVMVSCL